MRAVVTGTSSASAMLRRGTSPICRTRLGRTPGIWRMHGWQINSASTPRRCCSPNPISIGPSPEAPSPGWHLEDAFSQLKSARNSVPFSDPRTRIAHLDTGYDPNHPARPETGRIVLEHSFVEGDPDPNKAQSASTLNLLPQNLNHGTGTLGILAGRSVNLLGDYLGGAPFADIVELRIGNSVVLIVGVGSFIRRLQFKTSAFVQALRFAIDNHCNV